MSKDKFVTTWFRAELETVEVESGKWIFKKTDKKENYAQVSFDNFAELLKQQYEELDGYGYDVIQVVPIETGMPALAESTSGGAVPVGGFGITRGAVLVGKLRE